METRRPVVLHVADRAEALGYDAFFVAEGWGHDASVLLAEVATRTDRITLGTGVLNVWGRTPATIAMLAALHSWEELALHVRGARRNGVSGDQIAEVLVQVAVYCGVPAANRAFAVARQVLDEEKQTDDP